MMKEDGEKIEEWHDGVSVIRLRNAVIEVVLVAPCCPKGMAARHTGPGEKPPVVGFVVRGRPLLSQGHVSAQGEAVDGAVEASIAMTWSGSCTMIQTQEEGNQMGMGKKEETG